MNYQEALDALGLPEGSTTEEIKTAVTQKNFDLEDKMSAAPTEALKVKFQIMLDKVSEAEQVLSASSSTSSQKTKSRSPLSETKMADLPGAAPVGAVATDILQIGETINNGRYEIKEKIGEGGMGAVYHAFDTTRQEDMAIKVLLPSMISSARAKERFMNEAKISSKLSHPNIVNVLDVQEDGDFTFLVMELLEGQDLRTLMDNRKLVRQEFDEKEAKELATKLCDALQYAHKHTVHRDIKPENIWVGDEGEYKLMDFGIARMQSASQRTQTGAAMGTAYYMAPEQLKGTSNVDGRADQYALGILLYELLTGDVPTGRFRPLNEVRNDISKGFSNAVDRALDPYPEERFDDMDGFSAALQSAKPLRASKRKKPTSEKSIPQINYSPMVMLSVASRLVLLAVAVLYFPVFLDGYFGEGTDKLKLLDYFDLFSMFIVVLLIFLPNKILLFKNTQILYRLVILFSVAMSVFYVADSLSSEYSRDFEWKYFKENLFLLAALLLRVAQVEYFNTQQDEATSVPPLLKTKPTAIVLGLILLMGTGSAVNNYSELRAAIAEADRVKAEKIAMAKAEKAAAEAERNRRAEERRKREAQANAERARKARVRAERRRKAKALKRKLAKIFTTRYDNGNVYKGQRKNGERNGKRHGRGTYSWKNGGTYTGQYKNGKFHGQGEKIWVGGSKYVGQWRKGKRKGLGTYTWSSGNSFTGTWDNNNTNAGLMTYSDSSTETKKLVNGKWITP